MCGDYVLRATTAAVVDGPSPRAWGLRLGQGAAPKNLRAIPTRVGTTSPTCISGHVRTGHPHACGDYGQGLRVGLHSLGPSPRAWGLQRDGLSPLHLRRAIPTCVGTTPGLAAYAASVPGHPHVRGDYAEGGPEGGGRAGPSPRAWGLRIYLYLLHRGKRAIPTCVGTTPMPNRAAFPRSGHPHVRGDYVTALVSAFGLAGPSPRAWGLQLHELLALDPARAIPTCVGTTLDQDGENARSPPVMCLFGRSFGKRFSSSAAPGEGVRVGRLGHLTTRASRARRAMLRAMRAKAMRA